MVTLHVVNQDRKPISGMEISAGFWNDAKQDAHCFIKETDESGCITFRSEVIADAEFSNKSQHKYCQPNLKKYYTTLIRKSYIEASKNSKDGKWQPWNPTIEMIVKEVKNPIPMYAGSYLLGKKIPKFNQWFGFDMTCNDWVKPRGKGEIADIEVYCSWEGESWDNYTAIKFKLRFPGEYAGAYLFNCDTFSSYPAPYYAIKEALYQSEFNYGITKDTVTGQRTYHVLKETEGLVFRTRTRVDAEGNLISAHYGRIHAFGTSSFDKGKAKGIIRLNYYFNPIENDTNLEFDHWQNLLDKKDRKRD